MDEVKIPKTEINKKKVKTAHNLTISKNIGVLNLCVFRSLLCYE